MPQDAVVVEHEVDDGVAAQNLLGLEHVHVVLELFGLLIELVGWKSVVGHHVQHSSDGVLEDLEAVRVAQRPGQTRSQLGLNQESQHLVRLFGREVLEVVGQDNLVIHSEVL